MHVVHVISASFPAQVDLLQNFKIFLFLSYCTDKDLSISGRLLLSNNYYDADEAAQQILPHFRYLH